MSNIEARPLASVNGGWMSYRTPKVTVIVGEILNSSVMKPDQFQEICSCRSGVNDRLAEVGMPSRKSP